MELRLIHYKAIYLIFILIMALTSLIYLPGLSGDFHFDDFPNLLQNSRLHINNLDIDSLISSALSSDSGILKRPVSMLSFAMNSYFFGIDPYSWKIINLIIHLLNGIGIYFLSFVIFQKYNLIQEGNCSKKHNITLSIFISCLWLVHPLNLTSVLYIVQRMTSLSAFFVIWTCVFYIILRYRYYKSSHGFVFIPTTITLLSIIAIFTKENAALLPIFLLLLESSIFKLKNKSNSFDKKIILLFFIILVIPAIIFIYLLLFRTGGLLSSYTIRDFTMTERILTEFRILIFYLKQIYLPSLQELGLYHDDILISEGLFSPISTFFAALAIFLLIFLAIYNFSKQPLIAFGLLWFFGAHLLESTFLPLELAHEHRNYLALYGVLFSTVFIISKSPINNLKHWLKYSLWVGPIVLLSFVTYIRSTQWSDNVLHAVYEAKHHPNSARAIYSVGRIYSNLAISGNESYIELAYDKLERSSDLYQRNILPDVALIILSARLDKPVKDDWIQNIKFKLSNYPVLPTTIGSLMELVKCKNKDCNISNEDIEEFLLISLNKQKHHDANLISVYAHHVAYNINDLDKAEKLFSEAIMIQPQVSQYRLNLVKLLLIKNNYDAVDKEIAYLAKNNHYGNNSSLIKTIKNMKESYLKR